MTIHPIGPPRVARLVYKVDRASGIAFAKTERDLSSLRSGMGFRSDGPPDDVSGSTSDFVVTLSEGQEPGDCVATVEMTTDFPSILEAREIVEPYLQAWEIESFLNHLKEHADFSQPLRFEYQSAEVKNPIPISATAHLGTARLFFKADFPPPPITISCSPEVRRIWQRWGEYRAGRESLSGMGYYCLTSVEAAIGGPRRTARQAAANQYKVDIDVLNKLGELTSEVGDDRERRKEHAKYHRPYTPAEREWIERVVLVLLKHLGEFARHNVTGTTPKFALVTLADFPMV